MLIQELIEKNFQDTINVLQLSSTNCIEDIEKVALRIINTFQSGGKVLVCGNGGSASDSDHFAAEFLSSFSKSISRRALPVLSLVGNNSMITAFSNDYSFTDVFSRQVEAYGNSDDMLIAISTSGNSLNCIKALEKAREMGLETVSLTSVNGKMHEISDFSILIPALNTQLIQHVHIVVYHTIVEIVERVMFEA